MVVDVVLVRPLRGHRYKVTIHRTALMNPMKRQIDIRESKELSTGKAEGRIPIDSEGQTNKQHVNTHTHETSRSTARTMKGATQFFFGWPLFFFPPFPLSRACHGNYPRACHTKLSLIRRGQRKKRKKSGLPHLFQFSAHFQIERDAHLQPSFLFNVGPFFSFFFS